MMDSWGGDKMLCPYLCQDFAPKTIGHQQPKGKRMFIREIFKRKNRKVIINKMKYQKVVS